MIIAGFVTWEGRAAPSPAHPRPSGKRGKHLKAATMMISYGAGCKTIQRTTGLGRRRIRVLTRCIREWRMKCPIL